MHKSASSRRNNRTYLDEFGMSGDSSYIPMFSHNQYNDDDYDTFEDLWANSLIGDVIDTRIEYAMGENIKPTFKLRRPRQYGDEDAQNKVLEKYEPLIDELVEIDEKPRIDLFDNVTDAARMGKVFGRCVIGFEPEGRLTPEALKVIHSRLLGRVFQNQSDWTLSSVYIHTKKRLLTYSDDMIYFVNMKNSPRFRTQWYGYSDIQRVAGHSIALREITEFDTVEIAKSMFAGYGVITVDQENLTEAEKQDDLNTIMKNLKPGAFAAITKQGEKGVDFQQFSFNPDVAGLVALMDKMEQGVIGHGKVPGPLLGREEEANRATAFMKMRSFLHGPVRADRKWISNTLAQQWYERNIASMDASALKVVKVVPEFENFAVDAWMEAIDGLLKLRTLLPNIPDDEILRLLELPHLINKLNENGLDAESLSLIAKETEKTDLKDKLQQLVRDHN